MSHQPPWCVTWLVTRWMAGLYNCVCGHHGASWYRGRWPHARGRIHHPGGTQVLKLTLISILNGQSHRRAAVEMVAHLEPTSHQTLGHSSVRRPACKRAPTIPALGICWHLGSVALQESRVRQRDWGSGPAAAGRCWMPGIRPL